jgi:hypothetical protein
MAKNPIYSDIIRARERMVMLGFTAPHDDNFDRGELVLAAFAHALFDPTCGDQDGDWPFPGMPFKPYPERRDNLIQAIAFLVGEVERGDREYARSQEGDEWKHLEPPPQ